MGEIRLLIADHHCMVREALTCMLESSGYRVVGTAGDWKECLDKLGELRVRKIDLLILDLMKKGENGIELLRSIQGEEIRTLVLTGQDRLCCFERATQVGADGYLLKSCDFMELKKAIKCIMGGGRYYQNELAEQIVRKNRVEGKVGGLTKRELEVLGNLTMGMYNKEIAIRLEISERTVKNHVANIFKKIGVADRTQAAVFAIRNGLVDWDE